MVNLITYVMIPLVSASPKGSKALPSRSRTGSISNAHKEDATVRNNEFIASQRPGQVLWRLSIQIKKFDLGKYDEPTTEPKCNGQGIANVGVQATVLDEPVWIETFRFRVVFVVMEHGPSISREGSLSGTKKQHRN